MSLSSNSGASPAALLDAMRPCLADLAAGTLGVALSGGGDSVALTVLLKNWCDETGRRLMAVTVDHGLRPESAAEALTAEKLCSDMGIDHTTLVWQGWDRKGNLQDAARKARRRLIGGWARGQGIGEVALGHTLDDQAETFLMRLARGSGVDGLSAMRNRITDQGVSWFRPLLGIRRAQLRDFLRAHATPWADDPSNEDTRFDRVRARAALDTLKTLGLSAERLSATAAQMSRARVALESATLDLAHRAASPGPLGDVVLGPGELAAAPEEIRLRLLAACLQWVASAPYRPRLSALSLLSEAIGPVGLERTTTLHGCILRNIDGKISVRREPGREAGLSLLADAPWDGRWQVSDCAELGSEHQIGALGAGGLSQWPNWRDSGFDRELLLASPAVWRESLLIASIARDSAVNCPLCLKGGRNSFFAAIYTR